MLDGQGKKSFPGVEALTLKVPTTCLHLDYNSAAALLKFCLLPHFKSGLHYRADQREGGKTKPNPESPVKRYGSRTSKAQLSAAGRQNARVSLHWVSCVLQVSVAPPPPAPPPAPRALQEPVPAGAGACWLGASVFVSSARAINLLLHLPPRGGVGASGRLGGRAEPELERPLYRNPRF